jgi:hypothetical protein
VHIVYCTFDGEQDVAANGEIRGLSLALQWLKLEENLQIGWDHLNGVKQAHHNIPNTKCTRRPHGMTAESSHAYHQNPHMTTALALIDQALDNNHTRIKLSTHRRMTLTRKWESNASALNPHGAKRPKRM